MLITVFTMSSHNQVEVNSSNDSDLSAIPYEDLISNPYVLKSALQRMDSHSQNLADLGNEVDDNAVPQNTSKETRINFKYKTTSKKRDVRKKLTKRRKRKLNEELAEGGRVLKEIEKRSEIASKKSKPKSTKASDDGSSSLPELSSDDESDPHGIHKRLRNMIPHYDLKQRLYNEHVDAIRRMTASQVGEVCQEILPELRQIKEGTLLTMRNKAFFESQRPTTMSMAHLATGLPFYSSHSLEIMNVIHTDMYQEDIVGDDGMNLKFINSVLIQEAYVRIYSRVNNIHYDFAEKEMQHKGKYDGQLPQYICDGLSDELKQLLPE